MNPITRMMKSCINMPLKKALPLLFIGALVLAATTGCTSSTSNSNNTGGGGGVNVIDTITTAFTNSGYTIATPFTKSVNTNGNTVYKGVVDDGSKVTQPYRNNLTVVMAQNRTAALKEYNASIAQALANGYIKSADQGTSWWGYKGSISYPSPQVKITIREPSAIGVNPYGTNVYLSIDSNSFAVATDYQGPIS